MSPPEGYGQIDPALTASAPAMAPVLLIVDDDPVVRSLMRDTLEDDGFAVIEAGNGAEACERCDETLPALIVVDAMMPVMDGFALCRALRARPETAHRESRIGLRSSARWLKATSSRCASSTGACTDSSSH